MSISFLILLEALAFVCIHALSWLAVVHALLTKADPRSALGWSVAAIFLPLVGPLLYALFGISRAQSRAQKIMRSQAGPQARYANSPCACTLLEDMPPNIKRMARVGQNLTGQQLCDGNEIIPLVNGDTAYPAMLEAIHAARDRVFLATYIFNAGKVGDSFITALVEARKRGVDVRVLVDGVGALYSWRKPWKQLRKQQVPSELFLPPKLFPPNLNINLRNHRKMLICDNAGFTGGMNIADANVQSGGKHCVQDVHFHCEGPIVNHLCRAFLLNWGFATGQYTPFEPHYVEPVGESRCRVLMDGPGTETDILNDIYCGVINTARRSVRIMTPYFLPSHELMSSLRSAGQRDVDVRIILPAKNNLPYVHWASLRLLPTLLDAGVRIWFQPPPFAHTKLMLVDDHYCQLGSANLDARSLRLNFEMNMEVFDPDFHTMLASHMDEIQHISRPVTKAELDGQGLVLKLRNAAFWTLSPYL